MDARSADAATMLDAPALQGTPDERVGSPPIPAGASPTGQGVAVDHAFTKDHAAWRKAKPSAIDLLRHAQKKSGRRPLAMVREYYRLHRGPGRLTLPEYVQYGVYNTARYNPGEQARFLTNTLHWPITHRVCDMTWQSTTEDKWLCSHILARSNVRIPETLAVIDKSARAFPNTRKISTVEQLREFAMARGSSPFFGKENRGICSLGAFLVENADANALWVKGQGPIAYDVFLGRFVGDTPYLLQKLERNHNFFARYAENLATVRVCLLVDKAEIKIPFTVLKLPARQNIADSFWRPGNLACDIDPASGRILTVRSKNALGTTDHEAHPETGAPILGETVPAWDQVLDLARRCAVIFQPVRYQSMDIAISSDGPVLIEINTGGGFDLPQLASGRGFLTDEVRDFFRANGYRDL